MFAAFRRASSRLGWSLGRMAASDEEPAALPSSPKTVPWLQNSTGRAVVLSHKRRLSGPTSEANCRATAFLRLNGQSARIDFDVENVAASLRGLTQSASCASSAGNLAMFAAILRAIE